jgi:hypothetical protein
LKLAPIALFVYNRIQHTQQTIESLQKNELAVDSELFIFSDGPRSGPNKMKVQKVREYLKSLSGFKKISIIERDNNLGLAQSVIAGVSNIVVTFGRIIVLEDDMITSPYFLRFMNDALELYKAEDKVISIHGYVYPVKDELPSTFFLRGADCWGWGTWKRGWDLFEPDGRLLLHELQKRKLRKRFDFNGAFSYTQMLKDQINGKIDSWAIRWHASGFLKDKLTLYPGTSLIRNIGLDATGTHCRVSREFDASVASHLISVDSIAVEENVSAWKAYETYFKSQKPSSFMKRILAKIRRRN